MNMSYLQFIASLNNHRYFDAHNLGFQIEEHLWTAYAFDDRGAHWLTHDLRDAKNTGVYWFEVIIKLEAYRIRTQSSYDGTEVLQ
jgi:hypothetical protein